MYEDPSHAQNAIKELQSVAQFVADGAVAAVAATGTLTLTGNAVADETVVIGGVTYTFVAALTGANNEVLIGADADASCVNLAAAINRDTGAGTLYGTNTAANPYVDAVAGVGVVDLTAKEFGTVGNAITTTETMTNGAFGGATLSGGAGDITVTGMTTKDTLESVTMFAAGVPSDVSGEASIGGDGVLLLSTTNSTGNKLVVRYLDKSAAVL